MNNFHQIYEVLGIHPGNTWDDARSAYRKLVRTWHPDRFGDDESARRYAEERTMIINQAYQALDEYFQNHGALPLENTSAPLSSSLPPVRPNVATQATDQQSQFRNPHTSRPFIFNEEPKKHGPIYYITIIIAGILALISASFFLDSERQDSIDQQTGTHDVTNNGPVTTPGAEPAAGPENIKTASQPGFGLGSSLGEVFSIQGAPSRVDNNVWHYGDAQVVFENGKVTRWQDSNPPRLRIAEHVATESEKHKDTTHIEIGSSKADVRAIQGNPLRESDLVWDYGLSRIYFDHEGRVTRWKESPLAPLKIKR